MILYFVKAVVKNAHFCIDSTGLETGAAWGRALWGLDTLGLGASRTGHCGVGHL